RSGPTGVDLSEGRLEPGRDRARVPVATTPRLLCRSVNLATIIEQHPADTCALISRGKPTTYGSLREQVATVRTRLVSLGLEPGDRVAIVSGNNRYFVVSYLAALGAGLVAVPLNPTNPSRAVAHELEEVGAKAVVVGPAGRA